MRIGMMIGSLSRGGAERVLLNIASDCRSKGHEVFIVTQFRSEEEYTVPEGIERIVFGLTPEEETGSGLKNLRLRVKKLRNVWINKKPDVILSFIGKNNFMAIRTGHSLGIPVVAAVRAIRDMEYYTPAMRILADRYLGRAERVVFQSRDNLEAFSGSVKRKAVILKNPIDRSFFEKIWEGERERRIVSVGRVDKDKNHRLLIDAFAAIIAGGEAEGWTLEIYGDGELREELVSYIESLGLADRIFMMGRTQDTAESIKKAGVFVLPTNCEGYPNALIEAMILGIPCLSTDCPAGGPRELITHGTNGLLTPVGDLQKMKENLQFFINNRQERNRIGENAKKTAAIYSPETVLGEWEKVLTEAAKARK
ncbi:MAG: glycosyltransferase [Lachnospiraceae bacterium]|nr:glycosyltransferase [Lachnospiraceae bacterium]